MGEPNPVAVQRDDALGLGSFDQRGHPLGTAARGARHSAHRGIGGAGHGEQGGDGGLAQGTNSVAHQRG
jgi:hypothetical protein